MVEWTELGAHPSLRVEQAGGALRITINRPDVLNALDTAASTALLALLSDAAADPSVRAVLLTGAGRAFCAGADVGTQFSSDDARAVIEAEMRSLTNPTILAIRTMPKPVVAAVNGAAAGLGCSLALAADLVLAARTSFFLLAFANIGLTPDGGASLTVPARVGMGRAFVMALLAERIPAEEAVAWGLADRVVDNDELATVAEDLVVRLAAGPTRAYAATKAALNNTILAGLPAALDAEATAQGELLRSPDFLEGSVAFGEKRRPNFTGR